MSRILFLIALLLSAPVLAREPPYVTAAQVNLLVLLPPPPADDTTGMAEVLALQNSRTPARAAQAVADAQETVFAMYGSVLGERFAPAAVPLAAKLFARIGDTEDAVVDPAKDGFARKRPFLANADVHPAVPLSQSGSYPSGHSTRSTVEGIVLAAMVPEQRAAIFSRQADYAESRVIGGVHYPSDILAGMRAGTAIAAVLFNNPQFMADFVPARQEVRAALGVVP